jgi:hypothetical protein
MDIKIIRTNSESNDFIKLIKELDAYLKITDEEEQYGCFKKHCCNLHW